ncbi:MAG: hypothetical protein K8R87_11735 [Verrucomicrobia bacterium]|nr:hypothetical protein [Verrucomicrobiota bacterium]
MKTNNHTLRRAAMLAIAAFALAFTTPASLAKNGADDPVGHDAGYDHGGGSGKKKGHHSSSSHHKSSHSKSSHSKSSHHHSSSTHHHTSSHK